ncbi:MFS transporter [Sphingomonas radiodurans]|uniref:MFS transporter n=1 Tax=Sphingomonas radiodurans TaxID=2890321 RepID=UPI001E4F02BB|nr:MFS transporter [Sphingomonas radiodurans]WBH18015.1 MFS transporter [Sphingomonas radiodurans]
MATSAAQQGTVSAPSEFQLGGRVLAAALLGTACGASPLPFNVLPLVMGPIHAEYGWDFAQISVGMTIFGTSACLLAPFIGGLADRIGVRTVALWSLLAFGLVFGSFYFVPGTLAGWYGFWLLLGVIGIGSTPVTWSRAVSMWFTRHRGLALGMMLLGTSLAAIVVPQIANRAIAVGGWRLAFPAVALLPLLLALPVTYLWFREPRPGEVAAAALTADGEVEGLTLAQAVRGYRFWMLIGSIILVSIAYGGAHIHMAQIVALHGFTAATGASVLGIVALGILAGRVLVGLLFDRVWAPGVAFASMLLPAVACSLLMGTGNSLQMLMTGAFLLGFAAGAESDVIAFLTARYFGMRHYGRIYGMLYMPFGIGSGISPILYGAVRDRTGSYDAMLIAAIFMFAAGGAMLLTLGRYPNLGDQRGHQTV